MSSPSPAVRAHSAPLGPDEVGEWFDQDGRLVKEAVMKKALFEGMYQYHKVEPVIVWINRSSQSAYWVPKCAFQPVLAGHLSITASLLSAFQPVLAGHLSITASLLRPKVCISTCASRSPLYNSQLTEGQSVHFNLVLAGHLPLLLPSWRPL